MCMLIIVCIYVCHVVVYNNDVRCVLPVRLSRVRGTHSQWTGGRMECCATR